MLNRGAFNALNKIFETQLLTYLRAMNKMIGLLINFNVSRLKEGIKRLIL
ncbi:MAG: GxxExxY protein [Candidatus Ratteibacteria bacterium]|nr:GxxExxY protein [Candidatus Ratteibacteria bacterium]